MTNWLFQHTRPKSLKQIIFGIVIILTTLTPAFAQFDFNAPGNTFGGQQQEKLVTAKSVLSVTSAAPGKTYPAAVVVEMKPSWHINSAVPYADWLIPAELSFDSLPGITPKNLMYPKAHDAMLGEQTISVYSDTVVIRFDINISNDIKPGEYTLPIRFTYQPCNDKECRAPETDTVNLAITVGEEGSPIHSDIFTGTTSSPTDNKSAATAASGASQENEIQKLIDEYGIWGYFIALGLAFLTGLLLSFSPCTYPMIPITVSIFAGQQRSIGRGFFLSLMYVGSMAVMYGIMGLIVSLVGGVFGAWLASTPVVIGIAVIFVVFALSMFGLYELQVPNSLRQKLGTKASGGGILGSIILGIVAALVVSPCVGPFVAGILLYVATSGSPVIGFLVLFVFALGLGTLYIIVGTFSSAINALPGSGGWMESVKKFFGFVLLLMALYFLRTIIAPSVLALLTAFVLVAFGVFGGGLDRLTPESGFFLRLKKFLGFIALTLGGYLLIGSLLMQGFILPAVSHWLPAGNTSVVQKESSLIPWVTDLDAGLKQARAEDKPVLIDTWATWCANCKVLDKKTFQNPDVANEAKRFVAIKVQLEKSGTPITKDFMQRFGLKQYSLPTTLLLDSKGNVKRIMQGVVGPKDMIAEMQKVK